MATIATENFRYSHLVKRELWPEQAYCREAVTANQAALTSYVVGTVLGKITASGKYMVCKADAVDGSQNAAAIVLEDKSIPASTDTKVVVMLRGPASVSKSALVLDATINTDPEKAAVYAAFEALGIRVQDAI